MFLPNFLHILLIEKAIVFYIKTLKDLKNSLLVKDFAFQKKGGAKIRGGEAKYGMSVCHTIF